MPAIVFIPPLYIPLGRHLPELLFHRSRYDARLFAQSFYRDVRLPLHGTEKDTARCTSERNAVAVIPPYVRRSLRGEIDIVFKLFFHQRLEIFDKATDLRQRGMRPDRRFRPYSNIRFMNSPSTAQCARFRPQKGECGYSGNETKPQVLQESACRKLPPR